MKLNWKPTSKKHWTWLGVFRLKIAVKGAVQHGLKDGVHAGLPRWLIKIFLEACEYAADFIRFAKIGHRVLNRVVVFDQEQRLQLVLIQFLHADIDVMRQHKVQKRLLFAVELGIDMHPRMVSADRKSTRLN